MRKKLTKRVFYPMHWDSERENSLFSFNFSHVKYSESYPDYTLVLKGAQSEFRIRCLL